MKIRRLVLLLTLAQIPTLLPANFTLTILHFNDPESHLLSLDDPATDPDTAPTTNPANLVNYGGAARFVALVKRERRDAKTDAVLTISAGDDFLAGIVFDAGNPGLNAANTRHVDYDALTFASACVDLAVPGNHDFDMGPDRLAHFIEAVHADGDPLRAVSCTIDPAAHPALSKEIVPSTIFDFGDEKVGVVGATTWTLPNISSPGSVKMIDANGDGKIDIADTAILVQREIDRLTSEGVDKIILVAHLQSIRNDQALLKMLRGVDVEISGGGHEFLANNREGFPPNASPVGPYPLYNDAEGKPVLDKDGRNVPVVTAGSAYACLGKLVVEFDGRGNVVKVSGEPLPVTAIGKQAVAPDEATEACVVRPVYTFVRDYGSATAAVSDVALDGLREHVRNRGTNLGDLMADALLAEGRRQASVYRMPAPDVAVVNGGGIRCNRILPAGKLTNANLRSVAPFINYVTIVGRVSPSEFKALAEHMVGEAGRSDGRFGQIAGFRVVYDAKAPAGSRVTSLVLDDGRVIVRDGRVAGNAPDVTFATIDFLANGGDGYPFVRGAAFVTPVLQSEALRRYLAEGLKGRVDAARYPEGGSGRVSAK